MCHYKFDLWLLIEKKKLNEQNLIVDNAFSYD